jgi:beta-lactam-binding protein with PASTA domain
MIGAIVFMLLITLVTFMLALKSEDEILVPNVLIDDQNQKCDLLTAMKKLQEKGLYARVQVKHSSQIERGLILEQRPQAGSVVKQGRRILLVVSEGSIVDSIGNYTGKSLDEVRLALQEMFSFDKQALIKIKEPVMYEFNEAPVGTVIQQNPASGSKIKAGAVVFLDLVISKGPKDTQVMVDNYLNLDYKVAMDRLISANRPFTFKVRSAETGEAEGTIVQQTPQAKEEVPEKTVVELVMTEIKKLEKTQVFDLYTVELPEYPVLVSIELKERMNDETKTLVKTQSYGGKLIIPYIKTKGANITLYVNNREWKN